MKIHLISFAMLNLTLFGCKGQMTISASIENSDKSNFVDKVKDDAQEKEITKPAKKSSQNGPPHNTTEPIGLEWDEHHEQVVVNEGDTLNIHFSTNLEDSAYSIDTSLSSCRTTNWADFPAISQVGVLTGTPTENAVGNCKLIVVASNEGLKITRDLVVVVEDISHLPTWDAILPDEALEIETPLINLSARATDLDRLDILVYSLDYEQMSCDNEAWTVPLEIDSETGSITGQPSFVGKCSLVVEARANQDTILQNFDLYVYPAPTDFTWSGNGSDDLWSTADNWYGGSPPSSSDVALFSSFCGLNCNVEIGSSVSIQGIWIDYSFNGSIHQLSGKTINIGTNGFLQQAGEFLGNDSDIFTVTFTLEGGIFKAPSSVLTVDSETAGAGTVFTINDQGMFQHNQGKVHFKGGGLCSSRLYDVVINAETRFFNLQQTGKTPSGSHCQGTWNHHNKKGTSALIIENEFYQRSGGLAGEWHLEGNLKIHSSINNSISSGSIRFVGSADQTYSNSASTGRTASFIIDKTAGTVSPHTDTSDFAIRALIIEKGTFNAPTGALNIGKKTSSTGGGVLFKLTSEAEFFHNNGTINFDDVSTCQNTFTTIELSKTTFFNHVSIDGKVPTGSHCSGTWSKTTVTNEAISILGNFNHLGGVLDGEFHVFGDVLIGSDTVGGNAKFSFLGSNIQFMSVATGGEVPLGLVTVDKDANSVFLSSDLSLNHTGQDLKILNGSLDLAGYNLNVNESLFIGSSSELILSCGSFTSGSLENLGTVDSSC